MPRPGVSDWLFSMFYSVLMLGSPHRASWDGRQLHVGSTLSRSVVSDWLFSMLYLVLMLGVSTQNHVMVDNYMWDPLYPDQ